MNVRRTLGKTTNKLQTSFQRLSSGLRINGAKDDAAGLAITERMEAQVRGMEQARRNAADAVSLAQTVESGMGEISSILQRLRELAVQAANDTNTGSDRATLDQEASQLIASLDQIATSTEFNGQKVLDGTTASLTFQVGANNQADQQLDVALGGVRASQLGNLATDTAANQVSSTAISGTAGAGNVEINGSTINASTPFGSDVGDSATNSQASSAYAQAKAINASQVGVKAIAEATTSQVAFTTAGANAYTLQINDVTILQSGQAGTIEEMVNQINIHSETTGVSAAISGTNIDLTAADGRNINVSVTQGAGGAVATGGATTQGFGDDASQRGQLTLTSDNNISITDGADILGFTGGATPAANFSIVVDNNNLNTSVDLSTADRAREAMDRLDSALSRINTLRGRMGAIQNRLESTSSNLAAITENLSAAKSRIKDVDFAQESAAMTRSQILQQAASAMLVQANQAPQAALQLLQ